MSATDHIISVEPSTGTPDGSKVRYYKRLKAALKYAVKLASACSDKDGGYVCVFSTDVNFNTILVFKHPGTSGVRADYMDDDAKFCECDLSEVRAW